MRRKAIRSKVSHRAIRSKVSRHRADSIEKIREAGRLASCSQCTQAQRV
jgi:hypothetical protein